MKKSFAFLFLRLQEQFNCLFWLLLMASGKADLIARNPLLIKHDYI